MTGSGLGFDTCTVPSAATMTSWLSSPYRVVATYLGGMNWACSYGNFTTAWVRKVAAEGWRFAPLWVGRQAPCTNVPFVAKINPSQAAAEGQSEAKSAVAAARAFGFGPGTPVYFDMEGYQTGQSACTRAVLNFLGGWTRALHAAGYVSGVYSSASSGITDLAHQYGNGGYPRPDDIWIADWNSEPVLTDHAVPNGDWANHQRLHQYAGPHNETWGGATVNMDSDAADGLVAGLPAVPVLHGPNESAAPSELRVAPGQTAQLRLTLQGVPNTPVAVRWQVAAPKGLAVTPTAGNVDLWPSTALSVGLTLAPSKSLAARRYSLPITVTAGGKPVADSFVLVSVVPAGRTLPTAHPLVLYAADKTSMSAAVAIAPGSRAAAQRRDRLLQPGVDRHGRRQGPGARRGAAGGGRAVLQRLRLGESGEEESGIHPLLLSGGAAAAVAGPQLLRTVGHAHRGRHGTADHPAHPVRPGRDAARAPDRARRAHARLPGIAERSRAVTAAQEPRRPR